MLRKHEGVASVCVWMEQELCMNVRERWKGIKEFGAGNGIFSLLLFCCYH